MIASKNCYEVMADVFDEDKSYYKTKIEKIEQMIMGLYIAEENTEFDSFEHFGEYKKNNLKKYGGFPEKGMCCKTYEEAKNHVYECIDSSEINVIANLYNLYRRKLQLI